MASRREEVSRSLFSQFSSVFFGMLRRRLRPEIGIRLSPLNHRSSVAEAARGVMCLPDLVGSGRFSCSSVSFQVSLFRSTIVMDGDGRCFGVLVLCGLRSTTSRMFGTSSSTMTSFALLR
jgi:hypothetical protein